MFLGDVTMFNLNLCGSDTVIYSTIIALLISSTLPPEKKELIGNILLTIGQALITAESACEVCDPKVDQYADQCSPYMNMPYANQAYYH
ncbi:MAG: hypothetical protein K0S71_715 [Clostridia bacterium]|nr:hypothetical protein [Clostridia bacterium]